MLGTAIVFHDRQCPAAFRLPTLFIGDQIADHALDVGSMGDRMKAAGGKKSGADFFDLEARWPH